MSSVSGISSGNTYQNRVQNLKQRQTDFQDMVTAIQSNDLTGAQKALTALQNDNQGVSQITSAQQSTQNNPLDTDLNSLASALSSGDLTGAQKAFAALQQDIQNGEQVHHRHHHGHHYQNSTAAITGTDGNTNTPAGTSTVKVTA